MMFQMSLLDAMYMQNKLPPVCPICAACTIGKKRAGPEPRADAA
ncbi:MAG: hypothetical protein ACLSAF_16940 [Intestinimonas sp.]